MHAKSILGAALLAMAASCAPSDADRCGKGLVYEDNTCVPEDTGFEDTGTGTDGDADGDADGGGDAGDAGDTESASNLGAPCTADGDECAGREYDYCALQPGATDGYCTMQNCAQDPDDCPAPYRCCDLPFSGVPNFCVDEVDWETLGTMCAG
jgi:hypothetical protein